MSEPSTLKNNIEQAGKYINAAKSALNSFVRPENPCPEVAAQGNEKASNVCSVGQVDAEFVDSVFDQIKNCIIALDKEAGSDLVFEKGSKNHKPTRNILKNAPIGNYYKLYKPTKTETTNYVTRHTLEPLPESPFVEVIMKSEPRGPKGQEVNTLISSEAILPTDAPAWTAAGGANGTVFYSFGLKFSNEPFEEAASNNPAPHNNASLKEAEKQRNNALKELEKARSNLAEAQSSGSNSAALEAAQKNAANARSELNALKVNAASKNAVSAAALEKALKNVESARIELNAAKAEAEEAKQQVEAAKQQAEELKAVNQKQKNNARQESLNQTRNASELNIAPQSPAHNKTVRRADTNRFIKAALEKEAAQLKLNRSTWEHCKRQPNGIRNNGICSRKWATERGFNGGKRRQTQKQQKKSKVRQQH